MGALQKRRGIVAFSKRGSVEAKVIMSIATLLIIGLIGVMFMLRIDNLANDTTFFQYYVAFDTGLLMTTIYASPMNILYHYTPLKNIDIPLTVTLTDSKVSVGVEGQTLSIAYYYMEDTYTAPLRVTAVPPDDLTPIVKAGQVLTKNTETVNLGHFVCPRVFQSESGWRSSKKIVLGEEDQPGEQTSNDDPKNDFFEAVGTQLQNRHLIDTKPKPNPEINLYLVDTGGRGEKITAYIALRSEKILESRTLGCHILNELLVPDMIEVIPLIIPVSIAGLDESDPLSVLADDTISVALDLGDFNPEISSAEGVADSIYNGLQRFYGQETEPIHSTILFGSGTKVEEPVVVLEDRSE